MLQICTLNSKLADVSISKISFITADPRISDKTCLNNILQEFDISYNDAKTLFENEPSQWFHGIEYKYGERSKEKKQLFNDVSMLLHSFYLMQPDSSELRIFMNRIWTAVSASVKSDVSEYISLYPVFDTKTEDSSASTELNELNSLIGLESIKGDVRNIINTIKVNNTRFRSGLAVTPMSHHMVFSGNPGTGKTTVARILADVYKDLGVLRIGHLVETARADLVAGYVGQTAIKTQAVLDKARGGVLFIDEAYTLSSSEDDSFGQEAIDTILKFMEDNRDDVIVIAAGYTDLMQIFLDSNPGLRSRFAKDFIFEDYSAYEMLEIFKGLCKRDDYTLSDEAIIKLTAYFSKLTAVDLETFGNARGVRSLYEKALGKQANRLSGFDLSVLNKSELVLIKDNDIPDYSGEDESGDVTLHEVINELNSLTGLTQIKNDVNSIIDLLSARKMREENGLSNAPLSMHMVFSGNPGTGKTTVARILANVYKSLGVLPKGHLIETDRSGLVGGYVGQTALKVKDVADKAMGGVLFIDEAYTLSAGGNDSFGQEAIDTLLKIMEDHRDDLIIIVAGYTDLMQKFLDSNPGLRSRFNKQMDFADFNASELFEIFSGLCKKNGYILAGNAAVIVNEHLSALYRNRNASTFGNGRDVRNYLEQVIVKQSSRIAKLKDYNKDDLISILEIDVLM